MNKYLFEKNNAQVFIDEIKLKYPTIVKKLGDDLDDPVMNPYPFFCFLANRDPTEDEPSIYHGYDGLVLFWLNTDTHEMFISTDNLDETLGWSKQITDKNLLAVLSDLGWETNTSREWSTVSSPALNTPRTPNASNDTEVMAIFSLTGGALTSSQIDIKIDDGGGMITRGSESVPALAAATLKTFNFTVPAGSSYQFVDTGNVSITLVSELTK